jgi:RNA polymerase sigma-70 factor (ECF subfamily)
MKNARIVSSRLDYGALFPGEEVALAKALVRDCCRKNRCFGRDDFNDLLQEVMVHWWTARNRYDKKRGAGIKSYMRTVVGRKLIDLVRKRHAEKQAVLDEAVSLDAPVGEDEGETFGDLLEAQGCRKPDFSLALETAVGKLTPRQKEIYELLDANKTKKAIEEALGISRSTIYDEIQRIRRLFTDHGLAVPF